MEHFWQGGAAAYESALRAELDRRIAQLEGELRQATSADGITRLTEQIRQERQNHRQRLRQARRCLF